MNYASLPASTKFPASSVDAGRVSASVSRGRLVALAATEFLPIAAAAYFSAVLYHRLILLYSPDPAECIPEALLIAMDLLVSIGHRQYSRIQTPLPILSSRRVYCNAY
jgi:hypothetical protein